MARTIFITGGSTGIGAATAHAAFAAGWNIGLMARSRDRLEALALAPLVMLRIEGDAVDYDLQVFSALHAGGEAVAADDAETAAFYTLAEMERMPVLDSVLAVGRTLLGGPEEQG